MIRLITRNGLYTHKCVNCGIVMQYTDFAASNHCPICKADQLLTDDDERLSIPFKFISGANNMWRIVYHLEVTNC